MKEKRKIIFAISLLTSVFVALFVVKAMDSDSRSDEKKEPEKVTQNMSAVSVDLSEVEVNISVPTKEPITSTYDYPFNTLSQSQEWDADELVGFKEYAISSGYKQSGGELPLIMQQHLYVVCRRYGFGYDTALALMEIESGYRWNAVSSCGAVGYMQIIPKHHTERMERLGITDIENPFQNVVVAIDYLAELQDRFEDMDKVLTAYTYGVTGAYKHVWNAGLDSCKYSRKVKKAARRIKKKLQKERS